MSPITRSRVVGIASMAVLAMAIAAGCGKPAGAQPQAAGAAPGTAPSAARTGKPVAPMTPGIPLDLSWVDRRSPQFARFRDWVDSAVAGRPGYAFAARDAALLHRLEPKPKYCRLAVDMVEAEVREAEAAIAAGRAPAIAGDSYLEVGPRIADLAMTLDTCKDLVDDAMRARWSAYAEQAVWNVWHHVRAKWGDTPRPWTGWSVDNPGNNYYYSFVEATLYWALASGSGEWMQFLREEKIPPLRQYYAGLVGGGSLEGTGYGAAHMRLFAVYRLWRDATGEDLAAANPHVADTIDYWVHATVPTLDRFAPIGDQSRNSMPELYDYHRRVVLEALALTADPARRATAGWWLHHINVERMQHGFNTVHDLLPAGDANATPPTALLHHARGTGHLFARTGWDRDAMWLAYVAGPYNESHAHQEQGGFTLFAGDWLTVPANVWSRSGIQQGTETHNVLRFERAAPIARQCHSPPNDRIVHQCEPTESRMTVTPGAGGAVVVDSDLTPAYRGSPAVQSWTRRLEFANRRLVVTDRFRIAEDTRAIFQLNVAERPQVAGREATAGRLRVRVVQPADATITVHDWRQADPGEFQTGYRLDIQGSGTTFVVELDEAR